MNHAATKDRTAPESRTLTVYYNGACPICRREIAFYRRRSSAIPIDWVDATQDDSESIAPDLTRTEALARFHLRLPDGTLESGARGFGVLWSVLPGFRWLGKLSQVRALQPLMEAGYRGFLRVRPAVQRVKGIAKAPTRSPYPLWLERQLRSDHAGEAGAVAIYRGVLATARCPEVREFARRHLDTERKHLAQMQQMLPRDRRSKLLPLWHLAGFVTGALPALFSPSAVYATIETVETFVDRHYREQIEMLENDSRWAEVSDTLEACRRDEVAHRDEAKRRGSSVSSPILKLWLWAVATGSAAGVAVACRV